MGGGDTGVHKVRRSVWEVCELRVTGQGKAGQGRAGYMAGKGGEIAASPGPCAACCPLPR
jgi:hypothetical protein